MEEHQDKLNGIFRLCRKAIKLGRRYVNNPNLLGWNLHEAHCVKSVRIRSYSSPYFPAFGLNTDQNNSEYGHFLHSGTSVNVNLFLDVLDDFN